jgi:hypothetical protein
MLLFYRGKGWQSDPESYHVITPADSRSACLRRAVTTSQGQRYGIHNRTDPNPFFIAGKNPAKPGMLSSKRPIWTAMAQHATNHSSRFRRDWAFRPCSRNMPESEAGLRHGGESGSGTSRDA